MVASDMTGIELRSILEAVGHADEDAARYLSKSRSMLQKMKSGAAPVSLDVAEAVEALQAAYADALEAALGAQPDRLEVWTDNEASWDATGRPARWHRMIAATCRKEHGTRIVHIDDAGAGTPWDRLWKALEAGGFKPGPVRDDQFTALCPVCGDTHRSLRVRFDRHRKALLFHCFACLASATDIYVRLGFDDPRPRRE